MFRRRRCHRTTVWAGLTLTLLVITSGGSCPFAGLFNVSPNPNPLPPTGNRPPRVFITSITTEFGNQFAEVGDPVTIGFTGEDAEDASVVRVFASTSGNPTPGQEIAILGGFPVGPGTGSGLAVWDTTGVATGAYNIFAEIDDRTLDPFTGVGNPPVRVVSALPVQVGPPGSLPATSPPELVFVNPLVNIGLSSGDVASLEYIYADVDSSVVVTMFLDTDLIPTNAGDIQLPSTPRVDDDPVVDGDDPNNPIDPDSLEIRTNPRNLPQTLPGVLPFLTAPLAGELKTYRFTIDFAQTPVRATPYFIKATITDGTNTRRIYSVGSLTVAAGASGIVDVTDVGQTIAGARFHGFSAGEFLGSVFAPIGDYDGDSVGDFMMTGRYARPKNRPESGAAYLFFGRKKTPFPLDTDGDGLPDGGQTDDMGQIVDLPEPPDFLPDPYEPQNVGRFGGINSINSIGIFFRGTLYAMPVPVGETPVPFPEIANPLDPTMATSGVLSITHLDLTGDPDDDIVDDFVFGMPFISGAVDYHDDDPVDGSCDIAVYNDMWPNNSCTQMPPNDDLNTLGSNVIVDQGIVFMVDGSNDTRNVFPRFIDVVLAGQFDDHNEKPKDFEGTIREDDEIPRGMRFRGGWFSPTFGPNEGIDSLSQYGRTVAAFPDIDGDDRAELAISAPTADGGRGFVQVWQSGNYIQDENYIDGVMSLPSIRQNQLSQCTMGEMNRMCQREEDNPPANTRIRGAMDGDNFGFGRPGGQVNQDGVEDLLCGAPGADCNGQIDCGIFYVLFPSVAGFGDIDLGTNPPPHLRVTGTHSEDRFGIVHSSLEDMNGDGISDIAFAAESYDDASAGANAGFVGVIFGNRPLTGESGFVPEDVGTPILAGVRFIGVAPDALSGRDVQSAGDFNGDGFGDILISSPGETRFHGGQSRPGTVYLIFGGTHLDPAVTGTIDNVFSLGQVGSAELPGIVFVSRVLPGAGAETLAPLETVGGIGDVDGDSFDDIIIGAPTADFVNLANPLQRRPDAGEAYLIYGNNSGSNQLP